MSSTLYYRFNTAWLYAECYAYRRLLQAVRLSPSLENFDLFRSQKEDAFFDRLEMRSSWAENSFKLRVFIIPSLSAIRVLAKRQNELKNVSLSPNQESTKDLFSSLLHLSLWGNKCDLSISAGASQQFSSEPLKQVDI